MVEFELYSDFERTQFFSIAESSPLQVFACCVEPAPATRDKFETLTIVRDPENARLGDLCRFLFPGITVEHAVVDRFAEMRILDGIRAINVGDGAGESQHFVVRTSR